MAKKAEYDALKKERAGYGRPPSALERLGATDMEENALYSDISSAYASLQTVFSQIELLKKKLDMLDSAALRKLGDPVERNFQLDIELWRKEEAEHQQRATSNVASIVALAQQEAAGAAVQAALNAQAAAAIADKRDVAANSTTDAVRRKLDGAYPVAGSPVAPPADPSAEVPFDPYATSKRRHE